MKNHHVLNFRALLSSLTSTIVLAGCAGNTMYHQSGHSANACIQDAGSSECLGSRYQHFESHDIAFVEFTERGNVFDESATDEVLNEIRRHAAESGIVLITFIHGWRHNSSEEDDNVKSFKATLEFMSERLEKEFKGRPHLENRRLIGLYVGWRGSSIALPPFDLLSFWDRKAVAEEVGSGGVSKLLMELDRASSVPTKAGKNLNVYVVIGHSFGGTIAVRALSDLLGERLRNPTSQGYARLIGDGIIVLNPAIEATQMLPVVETALRGKYPGDQLPLFFSLSSDSDWATHYAFPVGQTLGLLTWSQTLLKRDYFHDRAQPGAPIDLDERQLDTNTIGNYAPFLTHYLTAGHGKDDIAFQITSCEETPQRCAPKGLTGLSGLPAIGRPEHAYPLYFIKTDKSVMPSHNGIFNNEVRSFVFTAMDTVIRRLDAPKPPLGTKADRDNFIQDMQTTWSKLQQNPRMRPVRQ